LDLVEDGFSKWAEKKTIKNLRFISSSSEDLKEKMAQGKFSEDYITIKYTNDPYPP